LILLFPQPSQPATIVPEGTVRVCFKQEVANEQSIVP
jgi:hypothetical protein